jgi:hypothetical protein
MAWVIAGLGLVWFVLRQFAARADERRRDRHEQRMAELMAEREALLGRDEAPTSLVATTTDATDSNDATDATAPGEAAPAPTGGIKVRCRACKALNDESATNCAACGAEL